MTTASQRDRVAILEEYALLAIGQNCRLLAAQAHLQQRPALIRAFPGQGPRAEQIACGQRTAPDRVMGDQLTDRPVGGLCEVRTANGLRLTSLHSHPRRQNRNVQVYIEGARSNIRRALEVRQGLRITLRAFERLSKWLKRLDRHDPGRYRAGKILRLKRPERLVLPGLNIPGAPIVKERQAKDVTFCVANRNRLADLVGRADHHPHLQLEIQSLCRTKHGHILRGRPGLPIWPAKRLSTDQDRRGAPVIADRDVLVVGQQWIVWPEKAAGIRCVMDSDVEIGVIADIARHA